jgi:hypothetical protein
MGAMENLCDWFINIFCTFSRKVIENAILRHHAAERTIPLLARAAQRRFFATAARRPHPPER